MPGGVWQVPGLGAVPIAGGGQPGAAGDYARHAADVAAAPDAASSIAAAVSVASAALHAAAAAAL